jgi:glycosyltransferase involved in cell wall biosynthesis
MVSFIVPCYNEQDNVRAFYDAFVLAFEDGEFDWHLFMVDDGSSDATFERLSQIAQLDTRVTVISFSRNFGKEAGLLAGMNTALKLGATHVAVMDADLQDPPELLPKMCARIERGDCDAVAAYRETRQGEPPIRSWFAHRFYEFMSLSSDAHMRDGARDFRLMTRRMVEQVCAMPEVGRFSKGLFMWVGYKTEWVGYENVEREFGTTSWSFWGLVRYAIDGIIAFSTWPLEAVSIVGVVVSVMALFFLMFIFLRALIFGDPVAGWPSMVCVITLLGGMQIAGIGIIGLYLAKVFDEVKRRPLYIVEEQA